MSFRRDPLKPPPPLYSVLPQPVYTPAEHQQRRDDHHQRPQEPRHEREPYRDPAFDYRKTHRYEPKEERYPWDQTSGYQDKAFERSDYERYHRYNADRHTRGNQSNDYLWIYHDGHEGHGGHDTGRHQPRDRYNVPVETHPQSRQGREYHEGHGYDTQWAIMVHEISLRIYIAQSPAVWTVIGVASQKATVQPAGLANKYDVKLTDLMTSIMDKTEPGITMQQRMEENKGYLVVARFTIADTATFVNALQANVGVLSTSYDGYVIGFAEPGDITVSIVSNADRVYNDNSWFLGPRFSACCFWFKHIQKAKEFFEGTNPFRQPDFPSGGQLHIIGVPLTYGRNAEPFPFNPDTSDITLLWTEFPTISERGPDDFLFNYSEPMRELIKEYGGHPNVSIGKVKAGWPQELNKFGQDGYRVTRVQPERVGRNIRSGWLRPESFVSVSAFSTRDQLIKLFKDPRFRERRTILQRYTHPTIIGMTLRSVKGTRLGGHRM